MLWCSNHQPLLFKYIKWETSLKKKLMLAENHTLLNLAWVTYFIFAYTEAQGNATHASLFLFIERCFMFWFTPGKSLCNSKLFSHMIFLNNGQNYRRKTQVALKETFSKISVVVAAEILLIYSRWTRADNKSPGPSNCNSSVFSQ